MRARTAVGIASVVVAVLSGCDSSDVTGDLKPIARQQVGDHTVVVLNARGALRVGKTSMVVEFHRKADDQLFDPGGVTFALWMPMSGMPPHFGSVSGELLGTWPGRYRLTATDVTMAGTWFLIVKYADGRRAQLALVAQ